MKAYSVAHNLRFSVLVVLALYAAATAATLPAGFTETQVASGLVNPTAMAFAPDGRLFVCEQNGQLRVIKNGALLPTPFVSLAVNSAGERGLLGVTFDPNFASNQFVYVYYTATSPAIHNRVSRFTASGDVAVPGSEVIILDLNNLSGATNHNGGAIHFGPDGKLYIATGENASPTNSQSLSNLLGKILRINADGSIPGDNPFFNTASGNNRAIWALGLRNPYTFAFQPGTGLMFINDVGQNTWEEINEGQAGANYGWPNCEGSCSAGFINPVFAYPHSSGSTTGCAITGGSFYNPATNQFPAEYAGTYFFADFCSGWIKRINPNTGALTDFATGIASPVDLHVSSDGSLYYLARGGGRVFRVQFNAGVAPSITTHPSSQTIINGQPVTFTVSATGDPTLSFQWQRNNENINGASGPTFTISSVTLQDNGAQFRVVVSNNFGSATSNNATLTVVPDHQVQFSASSFSANESSGSALVTVTRSGTLAGTVSVDYATVSQTADEKSDFTTALGSLTFGPGETSKSFAILLTDDLIVEGNEVLNLTLSNPNGSSLGSPSSATVTIIDNDSVQPTTNPADQSDFFVRQQYLDFLNREPDPGGMAYWRNEIDSCGGDLRCIHERRIGVSAAFFIESEFQETGFFIDRLYKAPLGEFPVYEEFMRDRTRVQAGFNLSAEKEALANDFVQRSRFVSQYPLTQTADQFVDALLQQVNTTSQLNLSSKRNELLLEYGSGNTQLQARAKVLIKLIEYPEYRQAEFNPAFVLAQYFGYLRRNPDPGGYIFWLDTLNNAVPNNYRAMVCGFITSAEYQQRFSPVVTRTNRDCGP